MYRAGLTWVTGEDECSDECSGGSSDSGDTWRSHARVHGSQEVQLKSIGSLARKFKMENRRKNQKMQVKSSEICEFVWSAYEEGRRRRRRRKESPQANSAVMHRTLRGYFLALACLPILTSALSRPTALPPGSPEQQILDQLPVSERGLVPDVDRAYKMIVAPGGQGGTKDGLPSWKIMNVSANTHLRGYPMTIGTDVIGSGFNILTGERTKPLVKWEKQGPYGATQFNSAVYGNWAKPREMIFNFDSSADQSATSRTVSSESEMSRDRAMDLGVSIVGSLGSGAFSLASEESKMENSLKDHDMTMSSQKFIEYRLKMISFIQESCQVHEHVWDPPKDIAAAALDGGERESGSSAISMKSLRDHTYERQCESYIRRDFLTDDFRRAVELLPEVQYHSFKTLARNTARELKQASVGVVDQEDGLNKNPTVCYDLTQLSLNEHSSCKAEEKATGSPTNPTGTILSKLSLCEDEDGEDRNGAKKHFGERAGTTIPMCGHSAEGIEDEVPSFMFRARDRAIMCPRKDAPKRLRSAWRKSLYAMLAEYDSLSKIARKQSGTILMSDVEALQTLCNMVSSENTTKIFGEDLPNNLRELAECKRVLGKKGGMERNCLDFYQNFVPQEAAGGGKYTPRLQDFLPSEWSCRSAGSTMGKNKLFDVSGNGSIMCPDGSAPSPQEYKFEPFVEWVANDEALFADVFAEESGDLSSLPEKAPPEGDELNRQESTQLSPSAADTPCKRQHKLVFTKKSWEGGSVCFPLKLLQWLPPTTGKQTCDERRPCEGPGRALMYEKWNRPCDKQPTRKCPYPAGFNSNFFSGIDSTRFCFNQGFTGAAMVASKSQILSTSGLVVFEDGKSLETFDRFTDDKRLVDATMRAHNAIYGNAVQAYRRFVSYWGTHYIDEAAFGGEIERTSLVKKSNKYTKSKKGQNVGTEASKAETVKVELVEADVKSVSAPGVGASESESISNCGGNGVDCDTVDDLVHKFAQEDKAAAAAAAGGETFLELHAQASLRGRASALRARATVPGFGVSASHEESVEAQNESGEEASESHTTFRGGDVALAPENDVEGSDLSPWRGSITKNPVEVEQHILPITHFIQKTEWENEGWVRRVMSGNVWYVNRITGQTSAEEPVVYRLIKGKKTVSAFQDSASIKNEVRAPEQAVLEEMKESIKKLKRDIRENGPDTAKAEALADALQSIWEASNHAADGVCHCDQREESPVDDLASGEPQCKDICGVSRSSRTDEDFIHLQKRNFMEQVIAVMLQLGSNLREQNELIVDMGASLKELLDASGGDHEISVAAQAFLCNELQQAVLDYRRNWALTTGLGMEACNQQMPECEIDFLNSLAAEKRDLASITKLATQIRERQAQQAKNRARNLVEVKEMRVLEAEQHCRTHDTDTPAAELACSQLKYEEDQFHSSVTDSERNSPGGVDPALIIYLKGERVGCQPYKQVSSVLGSTGLCCPPKDPECCVRTNKTNCILTKNGVLQRHKTLVEQEKREAVEAGEVEEGKPNAKKAGLVGSLKGKLGLG